MRRPLLLLVGCNVIGGLTYPGQVLALRGLPPDTVTLLRSLLSLALMAAWLAARRERLWPFSRREAGRLALLGTAGLAAPMLLGIEGVARSTGTNASILILLEPVSIVLFARLLLGERMGARRATSLAIALAGAIVLATEGASAGSLLGGEHLAGNLLLLLSGVLWGLYTPLMKPLAADRSPVALALGATLFAQALFLPAAARELRGWTPGPGLGAALLWTAVLGVFASFLGTVFWTAALRDVPAVAVAPMILIQPVVGAAAGALFLGERLSLQAGAGGVLVAAGVVVGLGAEAGGPGPGPE